jgi:cytoskeletal protein RodZ
MNGGTRLRDARESQGLTLRHVGDITKLSMTTLCRLERGEFNALPGGILIRGYLRAYAAAVGLAPEEIVRDYLREQPDGRTAEPSPAPPLSKRDPSRLAIVVATGVIVAAVVAYAWQQRSGEPVEGSQGLPAAAGAVGDLARALARATVPNATSSATHGFRLTFDIQPAGDCWVSVTVDGKRKFHRLFQPGEQASVIAEDELVLRVGEPAVFGYRLNGVRGRQLGEPGQPVTVTITRENYASFLEPSAAAPQSVAPNLT